MIRLPINPWCGLLFLLCACSPGGAKTTEETTSETTDPTSAGEETTSGTTAPTSTGEETTNGTTTTSTGEETTNETTTTSAGGEECPLDGAPEQCCCFADAQNCEDPTVVLCEAVVTCDDVLVDYSGDEPVLADPATLECALTALRDRTPGQIRVIRHAGQPEEWKEWTFLYVRADGSVFEQQGAQLDDIYTQALVRRELRSPQVFEQCLLEPDLTARVDCVVQAATGSPIETCLEMCGVF